MIELILSVNNFWQHSNAHIFSPKLQETIKNILENNVVIINDPNTYYRNITLFEKTFNIINQYETSNVKTDYNNIHFVSSFQNALKMALDMYFDKKIEKVFVFNDMYDFVLNSVLTSKVHVIQYNVKTQYNEVPIFNKEILFKNFCCDMSIEKIIKDYTFSYEGKFEGKLDDYFFTSPIGKYLVFNSFGKYKGENQYLNLLFDIMKNGHRRQTRNSITRSLFAGSMTYDLADGFPLLTTKKLPARWIWEELMFFLSGQTDTNILSKKGITIWESNTTREFLDNKGLSHYEVGDMGPIYGFPLRHAGCKYEGMNSDYNGKGFDQLMYVINTIISDPYSRRIVMTTFEPSQAPLGVLYPCHGLIINFQIDGDNRLNCIMHQRSVDSAVGLPFNIASYAMLIYIIIELVNNSDKFKGEKIIPGKLTLNMGDMHIYEQDDHIALVKEQLIRTTLKFPTFKFKEKVNKLEDMKWDNIEILDYNSHPSIKVKMVA